MSAAGAMTPGKNLMPSTASINSSAPLVNFFIPHKKLVSKTRLGSQIIKIYDKTLKTLYQRLMESSLPEEEKAGLSTRRALLNPVEL
jgi:hypothetical protein